ncbi:hypothetical protein [Microseira wollei]|uniref:hypothetical protein n=1 Tax=Microseira wollei TaxID=467598 RepID=UPI001CFF0BAC|nr:hypothetical protein [Microseira wollei]
MLQSGQQEALRNAYGMIFRTYAQKPGFSEKSLGKGTRDRLRNRVSGNALA